MVLSEDYFNEAPLSPLIENKDKKLKFEQRSFFEYEPAKEWLLNQIKRKNLYELPGKRSVS